MEVIPEHIFCSALLCAALSSFLTQRMNSWKINKMHIYFFMDSQA